MNVSKFEKVGVWNLKIKSETRKNVLVAPSFCFFIFQFQTSTFYVEIHSKASSNQEVSIKINVDRGLEK